MGRNYYIRSEIVFPSIYKVVRVISDQDVLSENETGQIIYNKLVVINYINGFSIIKTRELPKDNIYHNYKLPLYYDGAEAKFVVIAAAKQFFIYDLLANKLSEKIIPQFEDAEYADSQSGNLTFTGISSDGKLLSGEALDWGSFEYDVTIPFKPFQK